VRQAWRDACLGACRNPIRAGMRFRNQWQVVRRIDHETAIRIVKELGFLPTRIVGIGFPWTLGVIYPIGIYILGLTAFGPNVTTHFFGYGRLIVAALPIVASGHRLYHWAVNETHGWSRHWPD